MIAGRLTNVGSYAPWMVCVPMSDLESRVLKAQLDCTHGNVGGDCAFFLAFFEEER
jgi:hypothetical protein